MDSKAPVASPNIMKRRHVVALQHAAYEVPCYISKWFYQRSIPIVPVNLWKGDPFPDIQEVTFLVIMGGPMNIYEYDQYPWLLYEKKYIKKIIENGIPVLGICLGGQLIADVLGGTVTRLSKPEYGWVPITRCVEAETVFNGMLPPQMMAFQWHQDTFSLPPGAVPLYRSATCPDQGFMYGESVIGLQFHPELEEKDIREFISSVEEDTAISEDEYPKNDILLNIFRYQEGNRFIELLLHHLYVSRENEGTSRF